ncbi:efflux RND transporter periplasmic adaptor subunit [Litorilinea aerophila]|uniref:HlyD family efflux transporter periplasmic adaptor subunit n=1 Tax=Litorilinea aerophila TaxID=1204385 RepID=A0A540VGB2_9CHLR|nr:efflux RND transporter periplasmic adaptor subunit [Litorilinea aerophila]MCC9076492.1 efflux RND transporter periplasmic adaptor subunit [Litorilinea aerophila]GIV79600.1 MAG: hypothetical protein KatS3mg050_3994 [Litorilinea sp.]
MTSKRERHIGELGKRQHGAGASRWWIPKAQVQGVWPRVVVWASLALLLAACNLGGSQAEPTPVAVPTYAPPDGVGTGVVAETAASAPAAAEAPAAAAPARADVALGSNTYTGEVQAEDQVTVMAEVGGQVLQVNVEVGDRVQAGETLVRIDSTTLEAQRAQALAGLEAAQAQLDLLLTKPDESDLEAARAAVAAAEAAYQRAVEGPTEEDLIVAETQLRQAEAAVKRAQAAYNQVSWNPLIAALPESLQLEQATLNLEAARAQYNKLVKGSTADVIAGAYAQLAQARATLKRLEEGPEAAQIRAAEAQVRQAETALYLAQLQLDKATVKAPVEGVVSQVNATEGAMLAPGSPVVTLLSPAVKVTIAVEEFRIATVQVGQPARIRVDAYPDRVFEGKVAIIAPALDTTTRTVQVTIRPTGDASLLVPGMFATVELLEGESS